LANTPAKGKTFKLKKPKEEHASDEWRIAYIDMLTNILIFFIMAFSLSVADVEKLKMFGEFFTGTPPMVVIQPKTGNVPTEKPGAPIPKSSVVPIFNIVKKISLIEGVTISQQKEGLHINIAEKLLFDSGSAELKPSAYPILNKIMDILSYTNYNIRIEGHTDDVPIHSARYANNWELSIARSFSVMKYLKEKTDVDPGRLTAVGYGETKPLYPNISEKNRSLNRRVEIVFIGLQLS
jgi:chemotaxis protein MotB